MREYLEYYWKETIDRDADTENSIINQLSNSMKQNLLIEANKIVLKDSPIFSKNFSDKVILQTVPLIKELRVTPGEIIF